MSDQPFSFILNPTMEELNYIFRSPTTCYLSIYLPERAVFGEDLELHNRGKVKGGERAWRQAGEGIEGVKRGGSADTNLISKRHSRELGFKVKEE